LQSILKGYKHIHKISEIDIINNKPSETRAEKEIERGVSGSSMALVCLLSSDINERIVL